jgi:phage-related tail fiber protein
MSNSGGTALQTRTLTDNTSAASLTSSSNNLITERSVWNVLPTINGVSSITYNRSTTIYAPTSAGTSGQILVSSGSGAPTWGSISSNLPSASTSTAGIVKLSSATNSSSEALAATPKAVKSAYDLANGIKSNISNLTCKSFSNKKTITLSNVTPPFYFIMVYSFSDAMMEQIAGVKFT